MGSHFHTANFDGKLTTREVVTAYNNLVAEERYEHGSGAYSGTFATLSGIKVLDQIFDSQEEAESYIAENTEKRGNALAVRFKKFKTVPVKSPTFGGKNLSSSAYGPGLVNPVGLNDFLRQFSPFPNAKCIARDGDKIVIADQLTEKQKESFKKLLDPCMEVNRLHSEAAGTLAQTIKKLSDLKQDFTPEEFSLLKKARKDTKTLLLKKEKLIQKLTELDGKLGEKLYASKQEDLGEEWIVGGWVAE
jgi:hypothetical protein